MNRKSRHHGLTIKDFLLPGILLLASFIIIGQIMVSAIQNHYDDHAVEITSNLARGYASGISRAMAADDIVNEMLTEKVLMASEMIPYLNDIQSDQDVESIADTLHIDEINVFDSNAHLLYSNHPDIKPWAAYPGHPVYRFVNSDRDWFEEEIRANVVTGAHYKYGYLRLPDGRTAQFGVAAERVHHFLSDSTMEQLISEIHDQQGIERARFVDMQHIIRYSSDQAEVNQSISPDIFRDAIVEQTSIGSHDHDQNWFWYLEPVSVSRQSVGAVMIAYGMSSNDAFINRMILFGLTLLVAIYLAIFLALLSSRRKNRRLQHMFYHDALTGLPNAEYLNQTLGDLLEHRADRSQALILINCSNFKRVNMVFGYVHGNMLLQDIAERLLSCQTDSIQVFRLSADRFVLISTNYQDRTGLISLAEQIIHQFKQPFIVRDSRKFINPQIGIIEIDDRYQSADAIVKNGLIAINEVAMGVASMYAFYDEGTESRIRRRETIEAELREIIDNPHDRRLYLEFQPIIQLSGDKLLGFEALARLQSDDYGAVPPLEFIAIAEECQIIGALGQRICRLACQYAVELRHQGYRDLKIAVNVSAIELMNEDFANRIFSILREHDLPPNALQLEITESTLMTDFDYVNDKLRVLHEHQIEIALDDFGTGYSSFFRLRELHVDFLKIDRAFIQRIDSMDRDHLISGEIISMAHKFGLRVIAEGVESENQLTYLRQHHCDLIQGFVISRPIVGQLASRHIEKHPDGDITWSAIPKT